MNSFFLRLKNLSYLSARFHKLETFQPNGNFQRTLCTNCALFSNITRDFIIHDLRDSAQASTNENFGKVIDLGQDFNDFKITESDEGKRKKVVKRNVEKMHKQHHQAQTLAEEEKGAALEENESEDEIVLVPDETEYNEEEKRRFKLSNESVNQFRNLMMNLKSKKHKKTSDQIMLEGKRLINSAISAGHMPLKIFFSRFSDIRTLNLPENVKVTQLPYKTINLWSDTVTSQGVIGIFRRPRFKKSKVTDNTIPLFVICDNIRDPGNLGTILRITSAVGCEKLFLTTGCVDVWEPKVLRAGAGVHFHLPITNNISWFDIENEIPNEFQVVLADNKRSADLSETSKEFPDQQESEEFPDQQECDENGSAFKIASELADSLPSHCFTSFKYNTNGAVLILGGETHGLSNDAYQFAVNRNGCRVNIPMCSETESLNSAVSLGILSYEFRRQLSTTVSEPPVEETVNDNVRIENSQ